MKGRKLDKVFCNGSVTMNPPRKAKCYEVYLVSVAPLYRILFVLFSILALGTHGYFYCGCLLYLFLKSAVLRQVLTAVRKSGKQPLIITCIPISLCCHVCFLSRYSVDCHWATGSCSLIDVCCHLFCLPP